MTDKVSIDVGAIFNALTTTEERAAVDAINAKFEGMPVRLAVVALTDEDEAAPKKTRRKGRKGKGRRKAKARRGKKPGPKPGFKRKAKRKGKKPGPKPGFKRKAKRAAKAKTEVVAKPEKKVKRKYTRKAKTAVPAADAGGASTPPQVAPRGRPLLETPPPAVKAPGE